MGQLFLWSVFRRNIYYQNTEEQNLINWIFIEQQPSIVDKVRTLNQAELAVIVISQVTRGVSAFCKTGLVDTCHFLSRV